MNKHNIRIFKIKFNLLFYLGIIKKLLERVEKYDLILNRNELALLDGLVDLLEVFNVFSTFIQGNAYLTMNTFVLFYAEIKDRLTQIRALYDDENDVVVKAAEILLQNLDKRLSLNAECIGASLIDP